MPIVHQNCVLLRSFLARLSGRPLCFGFERADRRILGGREIGTVASMAASVRGGYRGGGVVRLAVLHQAAEGPAVGGVKKAMKPGGKW